MSHDGEKVFTASELCNSCLKATGITASESLPLAIGANVSPHAKQLQLNILIKL